MVILSLPMRCVLQLYVVRDSSETIWILHLLYFMTGISYYDEAERQRTPYDLLTRANSRRH